MSGMAARRFNTKQTVERVLDSDFDPGEATQDSQDEGDTSAHESHDEGENSSDRDTDYVDKVIKKDAAVRVKAR